ncbi:hypothetical protein GUITHDRAFT_106490 [Guillardia theta CCMP2712]|uniref:Uncharacterized protein n=1 Tax=Guillardia theta (strain CCMP2712) TaxID=905079 RepID=L1JGP6_GUITC|nr:hypothetical protein GUITHDRAFT_106490 [Guillardia theta CCMP2712]EKX47502.1 hypothetical protein GUITHDRAFT_106490 [Guillardia theta CCMP2712]|eukprot:XP_005834482.1 hypothetical protein GUITHDRAFT_106490 [Guillardia theta CCMP2712]
MAVVHLPVTANRHTLQHNLTIDGLRCAFRPYSLKGLRSCIRPEVRGTGERDVPAVEFEDGEVEGVVDPLIAMLNSMVMPDGETNIVPDGSHCRWRCGRACRRCSGGAPDINLAFDELVTEERAQRPPLPQRLDRLDPSDLAATAQPSGTPLVEAPAR